MIKENKYADIIDLPYQKSKAHPHMSNYDRAAQFAPFAALTGYEELIKETARNVSEKIILTDDKKQEISQKLEYLASLKENFFDIHIIYFVKDKNKDGGAYLEDVTKTIKVDSYHKLIRFNNKSIKMDDIFDISSSVFDVIYL